MTVPDLPLNALGADLLPAGGIIFDKSIATDILLGVDIGTVVVDVVVGMVVILGADKWMTGTFLRFGDGGELESEEVTLVVGVDSSELWDID